MGNDSETLADIIESARELPKSAEPQRELDIPQMFEKQSPNPNIGKALGPLGLELKYTSHSAVYLLWRPWSKCSRCLKAIEEAENGEDNKPLLPDVGEYTCPHNQTTEYKHILDRCLTGDFLHRKEEYFNLVDGTRCVHLMWLEPDPEQAKKLAEAEEIKKKTRVYPPDIDGAFKEPKKSKSKKGEEAKA